MAYQSIHVRHHDDRSGDGRRAPPAAIDSGPSDHGGDTPSSPLAGVAGWVRGAPRPCRLAAAALVVLLGAARLLPSAGGGGAGSESEEGPSSRIRPAHDGQATGEPGETAFRLRNDTALPSVPSGVNLGGWLSLEDWFYVGDAGAVEVATPDPPSGTVDDGRWDGGGAASCLPPLHVDASTGPRWSSETDLFGGLADHYGESTRAEGTGSDGDDDDGGAAATSLGPWGRAYRTVHAARSSYMDYDTEMPLLRALGIKYVRVPVSWCWTEYDPSLMVVKDRNPNAKGDGFIYMDDGEVKDKFACEDPFHEGVYWPAGG